MWLFVGAELAQFNPLLAEPGTVFPAAGDLVFQLLIGNQSPLFEVDQEDAARLEALASGRPVPEDIAVKAT